MDKSSPAGVVWQANSATARSTPQVQSAAADNVVAGRSLPSSTAALRYYSELAPKSRPLNIHELLRLTEENDPTAIAAITSQAEHLGRGLRLVTASLSPEVILITGDLTTSWTRFGPIIQKEMAGSMLAGTPPDLGITKDGELSRLRGAAAVVLQRHSGYHTSPHLTASGKRNRRSAAASG